MVLSRAKKKAGLYCCAYSCKCEPVKKLGGLCYKHYRRKRREEDPVGERYTQFKNKAKSRGLEVDITLEEFRKWAKKQGYIHVKGRRGRNATIDRRCNVHGYKLFNIQLLTNSQNASKGNRFNGNKFGKPEENNKDCPF